MCSSRDSYISQEKVFKSCKAFINGRMTNAMMIFGQEVVDATFESHF